MLRQVTEAQDALVDVDAELDRQLAVLLARGYAALTGLGGTALTDAVEALRPVLHSRASGLPAPTPERVPFVLVVSRDLAPADRTMLLTSHRGRQGVVSEGTADISRFTAIPSVDLPTGSVYAVLDIERGQDTLGARPDDALVTISGRGRSPLTVEEGIALITVHPESLEKNHCFQTLGSRCGDRRVPGLWISNQAPKLGFCWAGNFHTWLGAASCAARSGAA